MDLYRLFETAYCESLWIECNDDVRAANRVKLMTMMSELMFDCWSDK